MLNIDVRETIVDLITRSTPIGEIRAAIPEDDPFSIFNPEFLAFAKDAIANGISEPCLSDGVVAGFNDKLCQALLENDLTNTLESTTYPISLCHSSADVVVDISNLPDLTKNSLLSFELALGEHESAGAVCLLRWISSFVSADFQSYEISPKHSEDGCAAVSDSSAPVTSPVTPVPAIAPVPTPNQPTFSPVPMRKTQNPAVGCRTRGDGEAGGAGGRKCRNTTPET